MIYESDTLFKLTWLQCLTIYNITVPLIYNYTYMCGVTVFDLFCKFWIFRDGGVVTTDSKQGECYINMAGK